MPQAPVASAELGEGPDRVAPVPGPAETPAPYDDAVPRTAPTAAPAPVADAALDPLASRRPDGGLPWEDPGLAPVPGLLEQAIGRSGLAAVERVGQMAAARIRWDRVGRWALICVFVLVLYLYIGPARSWYSAYAEAKKRREDVADLRTRHTQLERQAKSLTGRAAIEREARKLGMVRAGEKQYVIADLPK
jgi:cell division protein FtsB